MTLVFTSLVFAQIGLVLLLIGLIRTKRLTEQLIESKNNTIKELERQAAEGRNAMSALMGLRLKVCDMIIVQDNRRNTVAIKAYICGQHHSEGFVLTLIERPFRTSEQAAALQWRFRDIISNIIQP